jgi:hypothetical protein
VTENPQGRFGQGDAAQLPGAFVVDTAGVVRYAYRDRRSDDNPSGGHGGRDLGRDRVREGAVQEGDVIAVVE